MSIDPASSDSELRALAEAAKPGPWSSVPVLDRNTGEQRIGLRQVAIPDAMSDAERFGKWLHKYLTAEYGHCREDEGGSVCNDITAAALSMLNGCSRLPARPASGLEQP